MGQYYQIVNIDKKEFLDPHKFNDGLKFWEITMSSGGSLAGLAILLSSGNGAGGGDFEVHDDSLYGRWIGDKVVIAGDYQIEYKIKTEKGELDLYQACNDGYLKDISKKVVTELNKQK